MSAQPAYRMEADAQLRINWLTLDDWTRNQLELVIEFCQQHGWNLRHISEEQSKMLRPVLSLWQVTFESHGKLKTGWIIVGDVPSEIIPFNNVPNAREALHAFSRKFLSKAQLLRQKPLPVTATESERHKEKNHLQKLVKAAADLLVLHHEEKIWE